MAGHLAANGVDLDKAPVALGQLLAIDPDAEKLAGPGALAANALGTRDYRAPFVVPALA
jgi:hypothetical protein